MCRLNIELQTRALLLIKTFEKAYLQIQKRVAMNLLNEIRIYIYIKDIKA